MAAPLSIIVPTLNAEKHLPTCIASLFSGLESALIRELIVADGKSSDTTREIADAAGGVVVECTPNRSLQLTAGSDIAKGTWLLFLHADTSLSESWEEEVRSHIERSPHLAATFTLSYRSQAWQSKFLAFCANLRTRLLGLPYGDQGLLVSRQLFNEVGGYAELPLMEDVAIAKAIGKKRLRVLKTKATTSAEKYQREGWWKRIIRNIWLISRYQLGASPEKLAKHYR